VCFCFLSPRVWFFLWLPEEVLALLFLLHRENRDFSILMKHTHTHTHTHISIPSILDWKFLCKEKYFQQVQPSQLFKEEGVALSLFVTITVGGIDMSSCCFG
jgi:hypothetical protein